MTAYVSFLQFFTETKQLVRDLSTEFSTEDYTKLSDNAFNIKYQTLLTRIQKRSRDFSENWFFGPSKYVEGYIAEVMKTKEYPRNQRFEKLLELTDRYMRGTIG